ncbi:Ankyrin repeat-containing domain [Pseudocohnilembus persalinus]|uniref:Ankyrin repeat-containing domain n=1 Tax=Pseudocohnilembus persalinus TaxID=266149 RepID=A0A0V0QQR5_PSEPJ|nr:Ankyrin repeat-containing domain [Pseudocohnilembus persalinus]|eukprot:KRX04471.1 Ankyrin repeat-containing domain [Pseudocohnilembus persalinus]
MNSQQTKLTATTPDKSLISSKALISPNSKKNEIQLDNDVNVIVEDYEEGESITWYKCEDTEENIAKNTYKWQNQSPKGSKLLQDQIYMKQQYIIKNQNTGECLDLRDFQQSQFQVLQKMIPDRIQIWKNWWKLKQQNNEQFIKACQFNFQQKIIEFLNYTPNDLSPLINYVDYDGCSPLHYAVQNSNVQICHQLLAHQADPNISNKNGQTPLILAILNNHEQITIQLIQSGANINTYDFQKNTPLHYAFLNGKIFLNDSQQ